MGLVDRRKFSSPLLNMEFRATWLTLILAVIAFTRTVSSSEPRVVCYYTNWSVYRPGTARFNPQNINPYLCTHLIYAFGGFTKENALKPFDKYQDIEKGGYAKFTGLKTYNKNLKTLLAIGGWNEGSTRFSPMVASRERRKEFVKNAIKFLRQNRFDGLDLDWEYPAFRDGGKPKDRENYAKLVKELREEFERESEKTGRPRLLLTMAVPAGIEYIQKGFDVKTLNKYLDWMNLLTYDYHSAFEPAVNHHAPLYPLEEPNEYSVDNELNIDYTIKFYLESGADRDKLVLGIPTYGRSYTLFNADATEIGAPADGPGEQGDATREKGYLAYYEICESLKPKTKKRSVDSEEDSEEEEEDSEEEENQPWTVVFPNPNAMGPVAYRGNQWVGYDDMDIVRKKSEYVADNGLGGIMFWSIDNDDFRGTCHGKPYPLIEAAKEAYINKLGSTDNAVTDAPKSLSSAGDRRKNRPRTTSTTSKPAASAKNQSNKRNKPSSSVSTTTPSWKIVTPEPPTTPDPGSDFKCKDEGFFPHPRDCKKYFWCLDSGPSNLGIVAHHFTCPSGLYFNKAADSCDFARNVLCKKPAETTKAPAKETTTKAPTTTTTTRRPVKLSTKSSVLFRSTTTTTQAPEPEEEYEDEVEDEADSADIDAEDPRVIKELIDLIKKVGGVEQLEKHLHLAESSLSPEAAATTTPTPFNKKLYQKVLERTRANKLPIGNSIGDGASPANSRRGPQNAGIEASSDSDQKYLNKDRPKYTTINRSRGSTTSAPDSLEEDAAPEPPQTIARARAVATEARGTTGKPLQYVNIRRARPATSDTADDSASRNALFERSESYATVSDNTAKSLDIASARRENIPEYVTIRRQRPSTEEPTSAVPPSSAEEEEEEVESLESVEKEISSPPSTSNQPQYTSIVRARSTTSAPLEPSSPEPTTVLAVQISTLINNPVEETPVNTVETETQTEAQTTTSSTTTTTTTEASTTAASTRRPARRRGTTTTTTQGPTSSTTQASSLINRRKNFLRRTKPTAAPAPDATESIQSEAAVDTTTVSTARYTRRGGSKFKTPPKKEFPVKVEKENATRAKTAGNVTDRAPSLPGGRLRSEQRVFVRRRTANVTSTTQRPTSPLTTRQPRPFRVASRRRPLTTSTTAAPATTVEPTTDADVASEEALQEVEERDSIEDPALKPRNAPKKTVKIQRRPLTTLREIDQNPAATNEEKKGQSTEDASKEVDGKRQSKKYSASFKQNQLNEVIRQKSKSQEEFDTVTDGTTAIDDFSPETAVAIAAHQLLSAPLPSVQDYDTRTHSTTTKYRETDFNTASTPIHKTTPFVPRPSEYSTGLPKISQSTAGGNYLPKISQSTSGSTYLPTKPTTKSSFSIGLSDTGFTVQQTFAPSTSRHLGTSEKYISVPIEEFGFSTDSYVGGLSQEPTYFTREYLLESPVTRTYDDEYQYLSPITTPSTTTRKSLPKKTIYRKISTTIRPTLPPATPAKPRRIPVKPFEKVKKVEQPRTYRPIENYDYYDDSQEKISGKYDEGTKVIVHGNGVIECLDIGNFPHPAACKKFISCARMESGGVIGWEYVCPRGLSFDPVGGICNWSAGLGCHEN